MDAIDERKEAEVGSDEDSQATVRFEDVDEDDENVFKLPKNDSIVKLNIRNVSSPGISLNQRR